jgi:hypothetical protein
VKLLVLGYLLGVTSSVRLRAAGELVGDIEGRYWQVAWRGLEIQLNVGERG